MAWVQARREEGFGMTAKEYLSQARQINIRLKALKERLEHFKSAAEYAGVQYNDLPKPASRNVHKNEDAIIRMMEMEARINAEFAVLVKINDIIERLEDPRQQAILSKRYMYSKKWEAISSELFLSVRHVQLLHGHALKEVEPIRKVSME
jgi:hypothetical protein